MSLKEYKTVVNGMPTVLQLSDEDAKLQGFTKRDLVSEQPVEVTDAEREAAAEDEARQAAEEEAQVKAEQEKANKEAAAPQNKSGAPAADKRQAAADKAFGSKKADAG